MDFIYGTENYYSENSAVTIGKFDGVHIGHRKLIGELMKEKASKKIVFSFDMYPMNLFSNNEKKVIYTQKEKRILLEEAGLDVLWAYPFTKETAAMTPEIFVKEVLIGKLGVKKVVVGTDFCFGKDRAGNVETLTELSKKYGFAFEVVEKEVYKDSEVSSTRIRSALENGNIEEANDMLGRTFFIYGTVVHGKALGRNIGIPTINIVPESIKLLPPNGVYASITEIDGVKYYGMTNIGTRPTVNDGNFMNVETNLFDCNENLYEKEAIVRLYKYTRPEKKYVSVDELKQQLTNDAEEIREYFGLS